ncbi:glycosyltransferase [Pseudoalteromonas sp. SG44-1]|uniref:glycosyltransferase family 2 protein n=1 Tax=Pseudoalteromonas sp. SG44-1 TaxID=2760964 RepID=UPI001601527C|nr:glycosyltransferase [Pseudoalteromonas sp. SG44-1]MBB1419447.1 glycosyltransferase [Pseudoalteromonas sp. SG44-1]
MSLISVYIPTHNRSYMLKRALDSVLNQSYKSIEIIIVDDGSSDDTQVVLQSYLKKYDNIICLRQEIPKGACVARNLAISAASGEFITGLDDDDEFMPEHIEGLLAAFDDSYAFVACSLLENTGESVIEHGLDCGIITLDSLLHYNKIGNQVFTLTSRMKEVNGFDEAFPAFQDYDTWVRLVSKFGSCKKIKQATYVWHTGHEQARISNSNYKRLMALELFISKHKKFMSRQHYQSMSIMKKKLEKGAFTFIDLIKNINRFNFKSALALYFNVNFSIVGVKWRKYKRR